MERTELTRIKQLFGNNLLGPDELNISLEEVPPVTFSWEELDKRSKEYLLVLGQSEMGGMPVTIRNLRERFGIDPSVREPCFYNQDWYLNESFIDKKLENRWYLLKKDVFETSRAVMPQELLEKEITFPSAILCAYTFFAYYLHYNKPLWYHDFIWCSDVDHNGDRIYVGKYHDIDGVNKNGFSIHRHLALRPCYAAVDAL